MGIIPEPGGGLEEAVKGERYRLGPGDLLLLNIQGPKPVLQELPVNLEGKLLVPEIGEIDVDGLLLDEARARIRDRILARFRGVKVDVNLTSLRRFQVHVLGQVRRPSTYLGTAVDRVSTAIAWAGGLLEDASQRRIHVTNQDTLRATADLFLFLKRGSKEQNPTLEDGDVILVPFQEERYNVLGAVNHPGEIEFVSGDTFFKALQMAGGFTFEAALDTIEVARYTGESNEPNRFFVLAGGGFLVDGSNRGSSAPTSTGNFRLPAVWVPSGGSPEYSDFDLQPNDMIFVRRVPNARNKRLVEIQGEVRYPGQYPLAEGSTRLSDIIAWAGGLTREASLVGAQLIRREAISLEDREYTRLSSIPVADMREDEYNYFKFKARENPGQMVVDFRSALQDQGSESNVILERGDLIVIPKRKDFVSILGMVRTPGNVKYRPGLSANEYIDMAGGFSDNAKKSDSRVIPSDGSQWRKVSDADDLKPGDTIMVPEKPEKDFWRIFRESLTVTTQLLAIFLVIDKAL